MHRNGKEENGGEGEFIVSVLFLYIYHMDIVVHEPYKENIYGLFGDKMLGNSWDQVNFCAFIHMSSDLLTTQTNATTKTTFRLYKTNHFSNLLAQTHTISNEYVQY